MAGDDFGSLLRSMFGPPEPHEEPPYTHVGPFRPLTKEELAIVGRGPRGRLHELAPLETSAAFRRLADRMLPDTGNAGCYFRRPVRTPALGRVHRAPLDQRGRP